MYQMERSNMRFSSATRPLFRPLLALLLCLGLPLICQLPGCGSGPPSTQPASISDRQDAALNDPMNYKIQPEPSDNRGLKHDINDFINP